MTICSLCGKEVELGKTVEGICLECYGGDFVPEKRSLRLNLLLEAGDGRR
ncbi:MAG: hypothetical protein QXH08_06315 [Candidatus Hadarchaeales archaeon]